MIRHGELISTPGTTDKVPGPNFYYLPPGADLQNSIGACMSYTGTNNGICWSCHGGICYYRTPYLGPRVINGQGDPEEVANDGTGTSLITVFVSDPDGDMGTGSVEIDLTPIGGSPNQPMTDDGGGSYSYLVTIPATTPDAPLTFEITATDAAANTGTGKAKLDVVEPGSLYLDDTEADLVCDWGSSSSGYSGGYRWHAAGTGGCTATWTPDVPSADTYNVYAWWKASPNRATDSPYTIYYDGGSVTVDVNQEIGGSQWNYLGNFPFAAGTSGSVELSDDADEYVIADAIKLTPSPPPPPQTVIVDNPNAQFVGYWGTSPSGGYNGNYRWNAAGTGGHTARWTPNLVAAASYSVSAWWKANPNRATNAPYTIYYDGGSVTVRVDQEVNGNQWTLLGTYPFVAGTSGYVVLSDDADEYVIADAIKLTPSAPPPPQTVIVDDPDAQFVGFWGTSSGGYNGSHRWHGAGTGADTATFKPNLVAGASYGVYAWWVASPNGATNAPYTIYYDGGSVTVRVDQGKDGNQWNLLGTYPFVAGTSGSVVLSDDADSYVIADAVGFAP
jgi:hypothetical protein